MPYGSKNVLEALLAYMTPASPNGWIVARPSHLTPFDCANCPPVGLRIFALKPRPSVCSLMGFRGFCFL